MSGSHVQQRLYSGRPGKDARGRSDAPEAPSAPSTMRAVVCPAYGSADVLRIQEVPVPRIGDDEVLVAVEASSVNAGDWRLMRGDPFLVRLMHGLRKPKHVILGVDVAGCVIATGESVQRFVPGDAVYGDLTSNGFGAFAEYAAVPEDMLAPMPPGLDSGSAAAIPTAGVTALQALRKAKLMSGEHVLVTGASGGVGSFAVQIAKAHGAHVTGVCSAGKMAFVRDLGADEAIDVAETDPLAGARRYDVIVDVAAYRSPSSSQRALRVGGRYVCVGGGTWPMVQAIVTGKILQMEPSEDDLLRMNELVESAAVAPRVDRTFPFEEAPAAIRYVEERRARGKVVLQIRRSDGRG